MPQVTTLVVPVDHARRADLTRLRRSLLPRWPVQTAVSRQLFLLRGTRPLYVHTTDEHRPRAQRVRVLRWPRRVTGMAICMIGRLTPQAMTSIAPTEWDAPSHADR